MQKHLQAILSDIKNRTGVSVAVYDFLGDLVATTDVDGVLACKNIRASEYENGLFKDEKQNSTYFIINCASSVRLHICRLDCKQG